MDEVLIDTDVILDFFFHRQPFAEYSAQVIGLCETNRIKGFVTPVICSYVYYLLRQTARHDASETHFTEGTNEYGFGWNADARTCEPISYTKKRPAGEPQALN